MERKRALVVGGTSGLGAELAKILAQDHNVLVTGRKRPVNLPPEIKFEFLDLKDLSGSNGTKQWISAQALNRFDLVVYAAGFYQEGSLKSLSLHQINHMVEVGLVAPILLVQCILIGQEKLPKFVAITSTSQWTPRALEPVYTATKAGLGMFANSLSLDPNVGTVLVVGPAGMKTPFWKDTDKDTTDMLDPTWVAQQTLDLLDEPYSYRFARIMRGPARVEIVETRE